MDDHFDPWPVRFLLALWGLWPCTLAAIVVLVVMMVRWSIVRHAHGQRANSTALGPNLHSRALEGAGAMVEDSDLPSVSLVMSVKFTSIKCADPKENWRAQVTSDYAGRVGCVFVVESLDDGCVPLIKSLQQEMPSRDIKIVEAGLSHSCTQKIHNMLEGTEAVRDSDLVLFLDANCKTHPSTITMFVKEMRDPTVFAATGYPIDIPQPEASVWAWTLCQFRWNSGLAAFMSIRSDFIWGGAMMMRCRDILDDACGLRTCWTQGGYSDDMLVAACAAAHGRSIATPMRAIFPNQIKGDITFGQSWDFCRRQIFVLTTWSGAPNCLKHSILLALYAVTFGVVFPAFLLVTMTMFGYACLVVPALPALFLGGETPELPWMNKDLWLALLFLATFLVSACTQKRYVLALAGVAKEESPAGPHLPTSHITVRQLASSLLCQSAMAPWVACFSLARRHIVWGDVMYFIRCGKVVHLQRPSGRHAQESRPREIETQLSQPFT